MVTDAREQELMNKVVQALEAAGVPTMSRDEAGAYLTSVMTSAYALLRTVESDEYVRGWLESAHDDLVNPPTFEIRKPS